MLTDRTPRLDMTWALMCSRDGCADCEEMAFEAWERMTYGGVQTRFGKTSSTTIKFRLGGWEVFYAIGR